MTWSISASGTKDDVKKLVEANTADQYISHPVEKNDFLQVKEMVLKRIDEADTPNVGVSASGSTSSFSVSFSKYTP